MYIKDDDVEKYAFDVKDKIMNFAEHLADHYGINNKDIIEYINTTDISKIIETLVNAWNFIVKENRYLAFNIVNYDLLKANEKKNILTEYGKYWKYYLYQCKPQIQSFMRIENYNDLLVGIATFEAMTPLLKPLLCN